MPDSGLQEGRPCSPPGAADEVIMRYDGGDLGDEIDALPRHVAYVGRAGIGIEFVKRRDSRVESAHLVIVFRVEPEDSLLEFLGKRARRSDSAPL
ncbi:MAG: hypothetical protein MZV64_71085 [Ignavibacteriales bacterium]|nr:hypothetical protein [Ignavibacteriales bacterium]